MTAQLSRRPGENMQKELARKHGLGEAALKYHPYKGRVHGTTRKVPRDVFEMVEKGTQEGSK